MSAITLRKTVFRLLDIGAQRDLLSQLVDLFIVSLIALNVLAVILESVDEWYLQYAVSFYWFEVFSVTVFSIEYLLRLWSCVESSSLKQHTNLKARIRHSLTPMSLIDLFAILPFYLSMLFQIDLRFMRALRLLRMFKLTRYSSSMEILLLVLRREARSFGAAIFILMIVLVMAASGIYLFEKNIQPAAFGSIPASIWWAVATLTTVGYGDVTPITVGGKIFGVVVMIVGVGIIALPTGILSSAFSEEMRRRRSIYKDMVYDVMEDGVVTDEEREQLEGIRKRLGFSEEDARQLYTEEVHRLLESGGGEYPHCGGALIASDSACGGVSATS